MTDIVDLDRDAVKAGLAGRSLVLVDVREPHEYEAGHVPGSISMPLSRFDPEALPEGRVVFSCATGVRSLRAIEFAQAAGRDIREHYRGGFKDWLAIGRAGGILRTGRR